MEGVDCMENREAGSLVLEQLTALCWFSHWEAATDVLVEKTAAKNVAKGHEVSQHRDTEDDAPSPPSPFSPMSVFPQHEALKDSMCPLRKSFFIQESLRGFICPET